MINLTNVIEATEMLCSHEFIEGLQSGGFVLALCAAQPVGLWLLIVAIASVAKGREGRAKVLQISYPIVVYILLACGMIALIFQLIIMYR